MVEEEQNKKTKTNAQDRDRERAVKKRYIFRFTVAAHLRAAALMETQHFFFKGHSTQAQIFMC